MASGIVRVTPGMLPAIKMVAPNSPRARLKAKMAPVKIPFHANGMEMVKNMRSSEAPKVRATSSTDGSMESKADRTV